MHIEKLKLAAQILSEPTELTFDMDRWFCNTSACALGHIALSEKFEGLTIVGRSICYNNKCGFTAAMELFNISQDASNLLFDPTTFTNYLRSIRSSITTKWYRENPDAICVLDSAIWKIKAPDVIERINWLIA